MASETTQINHTTFSPHLYMAIELSKAEWKLGFTVGLGQAQRLRSLTARELAGLMEEIRLSKVRFGLPESTQVFRAMKLGEMVSGCIAI